jgi:hypothetical protein
MFHFAPKTWRPRSAARVEATDDATKMIETSFMILVKLVLSCLAVVAILLKINCELRGSFSNLKQTREFDVSGSGLYIKEEVSREMTWMTEWIADLCRDIGSLGRKPIV